MQGQGKEARQRSKEERQGGKEARNKARRQGEVAMNSLVAHHLLVFTLCSRQMSSSHPEKAAHHQHEKDAEQELIKGHQQDGNLTGGNLTSDDTSHAILENSLEAKNGTAVEYEVGFVKKENGGVAYHLTFAKKAPPAELAEPDIPGEGDQDDGTTGEGDQVEGAQGDQVDEGVTEYWYGAPPLQESGPIIESGNGGRFKPQKITYEAAGKGNDEAPVEGGQNGHELIQGGQTDQKLEIKKLLNFLPTTDALKGKKRSDHRNVTTGETSPSHHSFALL